MHRRAANPGEIAGILVGASAAARELREEIALASRVPIRLMIAGEQGVGKKRLAKLIHRRSVRSHAPFVSVRCADSESELEPRLFGHRYHAAGALERADGGTVFLEDVDALSPGVQARLMRFVATGHLQPAGTKPVGRQTNVRLVCATRTPLVENLATGVFSRELYYLLNTMYLSIPPLRERPEDIEPLLEYFTGYYARRAGVAVPRLSHACRASCRAHHWPGNVRQLQTAASLLVARRAPDAPAAVLESAARVYRQQPAG
ncbi:MAG: sigma-54-dependent transcriptional regulator [Vicinamibacterales bacterium]